MATRPKRPLSGYMLWLSSAREQIKKDHPGIRVTEIARKGGEMWRGMADKTNWEAKAVLAKAEYEDACRNYEQSCGLPAGSGKKRSKPVKKLTKTQKEEGSDYEPI